MDSSMVEDRGQVYHPAFGEAVRYHLTELPDDPDLQVAATIHAMQQMAAMDSSHPLIQEDAARALVEGNGDPIVGVFWFVKKRLQFQQDEDLAGKLPPQFESRNIIEVLIRPVDASMLLRRGRATPEDCDGFATYAAALLSALGIECSFCTVAVDSQDPSRYSHVYLVAYPSPGQRVPFDTSHGDYPGWECPNLYGKRKEWPVSGAGVLGKLLLVIGLVVFGVFAFFGGERY